MFSSPNTFKPLHSLRFGVGGTAGDGSGVKVSKAVGDGSLPSIIVFDVVLVL